MLEPIPIPEQQQTNEAMIRQLMDVFRRRRVIIVQTFVFVVTVGCIVTFMTKATYRSMTRIVVEGKSSPLGGSSQQGMEMLKSLLPDDFGHDIPTQMEVIGGEKMVAMASAAAGLPKFGTSQNDAVIAVKQVKDTDVLDITSESHRPDWAQKLAHQLPITYGIDVNKNRKMEVEHALEKAKEKLAIERSQLDHAQRALQAFHERNGISDLDTQRNGQIADVISAQAAVRTAESDLAGTRSRVAKLIQARDALPRMIKQPTTIPNTDQVNSLKTELDELKKDREGLAVRLKPNHPQIQAIDAQIANVQGRFANTPKTITQETIIVNPVISDYDEKIADAESTMKGQQAALTDATASANAITSDLNKYNRIEREEITLVRTITEHSNRADELISTVDQLGVNAAATHDPVQIVSEASQPEKVAPKTATNIITACMLGLLLGIGLAYLQEFLDDRIHGPDDARNLLGVPTLGYVPLVNPGEPPLLENTSSGFLLESYRVLRSNVQFATVDLPKMSVLVTSTVPSEGKSVTAANLAVAMAMDNKKVILVDSDLRRPTLHDKFSFSRQPGLTDILRGKATLEEALHESTTPGLYIISAGALPPNPAELLNSQAMRQLHAALKEEADVVIFDSPPCLASADAQVLSSEVDGILYVMQLGIPKKSAVLHSFGLLTQAHARILGLVYNKIDLTGKRSGYYGYYGYYSYYDYYRQYNKEGIEDDSTRKSSARISGKKSLKGATGEAVVVKQNGAEQDKKES